ncbi:MAG TPA: isoprenylcysteine carboxylmethyltransferase family protein, partial [Caulobacteraceae bacterium]|nr:isoprenylcysteine carboxylmethyltransferase family protein [Caulobacteraceae bacterium]
LDGAPIVRSGPYRLIRHPNYWVVVAEIAVLPLAFHDWAIALVWSILNALLLRHRIRVETAALAPRVPARGTDALAAD